jgi:hypothetical protein
MTTCYDDERCEYFALDKDGWFVAVADTLEELEDRLDKYVNNTWGSHKEDDNNGDECVTIHVYRRVKRVRFTQVTTVEKEVLV